MNKLGRRKQKVEEKRRRRGKIGKGGEEKE